jgi:pimeloyl-ACP methyl ester carboxylesterase
MNDKRELHLPQGTIRYRDTGGTGAPLLFVHGIGVNGNLWRKVVPRLSKDFRCIVPDWPLGSHDVPMNRDADLTPPGLARMIADLMEALDLRGVTLIGNDTGGALAQLVAADYPDRLARLVLVSCDLYEYFFPPVIRPLQMLARVPGFLSLLGQALRNRMLQRLPVAYGWVMKRPGTREEMNAYLNPPRKSAGVRRDLKKFLISVKNRYTIEAAEKLKSFDKPTLLVWAREEKFFPLEAAHRLASSMPQARLEQVEDSYTFIPEDQPVKLAQLISDFVKQQASVAA